MSLSYEKQTSAKRGPWSTIVDEAMTIVDEAISNMSSPKPSSSQVLISKLFASISRWVPTIDLTWVLIQVISESASFWRIEIAGQVIRRSLKRINDPKYFSGSHETFAKKRLRMGEILYYKLLETILQSEKAKGKPHDNLVSHILMMFFWWFFIWVYHKFLLRQHSFKWLYLLPPIQDWDHLCYGKLGWVGPLACLYLLSVLVDKVQSFDHWLLPSRLQVPSKWYQERMF